MNIQGAEEYIKKEYDKLSVELEREEIEYKKYESLCEEYEYKVKSMKQNFDFAYETFSPIPVESNLQKAQIEELKSQQEKNRETKEALFLSIKEKKQKKEELESILKNNIRSASESKTSIKILEEQEAERQRIARDLHDTTVQNLTALTHKIEFCTKIIDSDVIRAKLELEVMKKVIRESIEGMREIIYDLRPMTFDDMGFEDTLHRAINRLQNSMDPRIHFQIIGTIYEIESVIQLSILRLIQEGASNCAKHAQADNFFVTLAYESDTIKLLLEDDGKGFYVEQKENYMRNNNSGFGISMMKERVKMLDGTFEIMSEKDKGTHICAIIPVRKMEE